MSLSKSFRAVGPSVVRVRLAPCRSSDALAEKDLTMTTETPGAFHPSTRLYRFTILIFISLLVLGSYFAYDSIGALENTLMVELKLDRSTIGTLYTAYSVAAIGIVFLDRKSTRL